MNLKVLPLTFIKPSGDEFWKGDIVPINLENMLQVNKAIYFIESR